MFAPRPLITETSRPYWDGLRQNRILLQYCAECRVSIFYPRLFCPDCGTEPEWREAGGRAWLYTFTVAEAPVSPDFVEAVPLCLAVAELEEGVRIPTTLARVAPDEIRIGMALEPWFDHETFGDVTLLRFVPAIATQPPAASRQD